MDIHSTCVRIRTLEGMYDALVGIVHLQWVADVSEFSFRCDRAYERKSEVHMIRRPLVGLGTDLAALDVCAVSAAKGHVASWKSRCLVRSEDAIRSMRYSDHWTSSHIADGGKMKAQWDHEVGTRVALRFLFFLNVGHRKRTLRRGIDYA
jgi:hypothetical protein